MTHRVLISVDDSVPSTAALEYAVLQFSDAELTVLHVCRVAKADDSIPQRMLKSEYETARQAAEELAEQLFEIARTLAEQSDKTLTTALEYGPLSERICAYAEENEIDQIVIGTHGRCGLSRFLLGSVAEGVLRRSSIPVTIVPEPDRVIRE
jgi:nucleotide-binding universal stress UspA family protein